MKDKARFDFLNIRISEENLGERELDNSFYMVRQQIHSLSVKSSRL